MERLLRFKKSVFSLYYLPFWVLVGYVILTHLLYFPTWQSGFVTDFTGLAWRIESHRFLDFFNSFGFPALQPVLNFFLAIMYKGFHINGLPWYLAFTSLHIANAWLLFRLLRVLAVHFGASNTNFIAIAGSSLFLLSPYASEPVTWRVCLGFLLSSYFLLQMLRLSLQWLQTNHSKSLQYLLLLLFLALCTLEFAFVTPLLTLLLLLVHTLHTQEFSLLLKRIAISVLPQILLIGLYLGLQAWVTGQWIGHHGAAVHLRFVPLEMLGQGLQYLAKYALFARYFEHATKTTIFQSCHAAPILWGSWCVLLALAGSYLIFFKKLSGTMRLAGLLLPAFFIALLPVLNLYFNYLLLVEHDRYGYLAAMFFWPFVAALLTLLPRWLRYAIVAVLLVLSGFLLHKTNRYWQESTQVYQALWKDFQWYDAKVVYVLNLPDNYNGVPLFRDNAGTHRALPDALQYLRRQPYEGQLYEVLQYNMTTPSDGVSVSSDAAQMLTTTFRQWGNWWWRRGIGATNYETSAYTIRLDGQSFHLQLLEPPPTDAVFIYQNGAGWERFTFSSDDHTTK